MNHDLNDLKKYIIEQVDELELIELLDLHTDEILDRFQDKLLHRYTEIIFKLGYGTENNNEDEEV